MMILQTVYDVFPDGDRNDQKQAFLHINLNVLASASKVHSCLFRGYYQGVQTLN